MNRDDVIRMAREAGFASADFWPDDFQGLFGCVERFAALVAAAERKACAKVCEDKAMHCETKAQEAIDAGEHDEVSAVRSTAWQISVCAAAIRARGQE